jgi:hypothetical protein
LFNLAEKRRLMLRGATSVVVVAMQAGIARMLAFVCHERGRHPPKTVDRIRTKYGFTNLSGGRISLRHKRM